MQVTGKSAVSSGFGSAQARRATHQTLHLLSWGKQNKLEQIDRGDGLKVLHIVELSLDTKPTINWKPASKRKVDLRVFM